jgi:hypothetical protein
MKLEQLLLLHLMAGVGVAVGVYLSAPSRHRAARWSQTLAAVIFWPLFLPLLLSNRRQEEGESKGQPAPGSPDELDRAIAQVDAELETALQSLDGWGETLRERGQGRLQQLRSAWTALAGRVRDMDQILARSRSVQTEGALFLGAERARDSQEAIRQNFELLEQVRQQTLDDLLGVLARVRELISMIHLARFTGAPASRAEELVAQLGTVAEEIAVTIGQQELGGNGMVAFNKVREEVCRLNRQ